MTRNKLPITRARPLVRRVLDSRSEARPLLDRKGINDIGRLTCIAWHRPSAGRRTWHAPLEHASPMRLVNSRHGQPSFVLRVVSRIPVIPFDKNPVDLFWEDAERIFQTARTAATTDSDPAEFAILVNSDGAIRVVDAVGWQLDSLRAEYGATTAYRVARSGARVCVEGLSGRRSCSLQTEHPAAAARSMPPPPIRRDALPLRPALTEVPRANLAQRPAVVAIECLSRRTCIQDLKVGDHGVAIRHGFPVSSL